MIPPHMALAASRLARAMTVMFACLMGLLRSWRRVAHDPGSILRHSHLDTTDGLEARWPRRDDAQDAGAGGVPDAESAPGEGHRPGVRSGRVLRPGGPGAGQVRDGAPGRNRRHCRPARAAAAFGFSRQSLYAARAALRRAGAGRPDPGKPGPKSGHKLTGEVVSQLEELLAADPRLRPADLAAAAGQRFGVSVHPRSVERALQRRRKARSAAGQAGQQAPKS